jgi:hypothetical protein
MHPDSDPMPARRWAWLGTRANRLGVPPFADLASFAAGARERLTGEARESGWAFDEGRPALVLRGGDTIAADRNVAHEDVRLAAHYGLNSDIALGSVLCQKSTPASGPNGYFEVAVIISL